MASIWTLQSHSLSFQPSIWGSKHRLSSHVVELGPNFGLSNGYLDWNRSRTARRFVLRAVNSSVEGKCTQNEVGSNDSVKSKDPVEKFHEMISSFPPVVFVMRRHINSGFTIGLSIAMAFCVVAMRVYAVRRSQNRQPGSVADLVRRGQLRSDRRGISRPLKYEDPFNNPMVKVGKGNSTVEMCGKVYRLAPVTLTEEEQAIHQKRRSRAYQWKRPTVFLKEGDSIPPDVDPDTIRWIPANHPFATTASDIDEDLAQNNVYQKHSVPFRIRAEHEALQRKLEALQSEQKLDKLVIDPSNAKEFERPFKSPSKSHEHVDSDDNEAGNSKLPPPKSDCAFNSFGSNSSYEEMQKQ